MIKFDKINLRYDDKILFEDYTLNIKQNEKILLTGPSGCGKTSLLKTVLGFSKIDKGDIYFNNLPLNKKNIKKFRSNIFYLSQDIDFRNEKVLDIIKEVYSYDLNKKHRFDLSKVKEEMKELNLEETILEKNISTLSGGERQRTGLLICFLLNRPVLLLDEPTSALDEEMKKKIADSLLKMERTILIISHDELFLKNNNFKKVELS